MDDYGISHRFFEGKYRKVEIGIGATECRRALLTIVETHQKR